MPFIVRELSRQEGETLQKKYNITYLEKYPSVPDRIIEDVERDAFLVGVQATQGYFIDGKPISFGGPGKDMLVWNGNRIRVEYHNDFAKDESKSTTVITRLVIPNEYKSKKNVIIDILKEAIVANNKNLFPLSEKIYEVRIDKNCRFDFVLEEDVWLQR